MKKIEGAPLIPFEDAPKTFKLPALHHSTLEDALDEIELLNFPLCDPFSLIEFNRGPFVPAKEMSAHVGKEVEVMTYFITQKPVRTVKGVLMYFGTFIAANM